MPPELKMILEAFQAGLEGTFVYTQTNLSSLEPSPSPASSANPLLISDYPQFIHNTAKL